MGDEQTVCGSAVRGNAGAVTDCCGEKIAEQLDLPVYQRPDPHPRSCALG